MIMSSLGFHFTSYIPKLELKKAAIQKCQQTQGEKQQQQQQQQQKKPLNESLLSLAKGPEKRAA